MCPALSECLGLERCTNHEIRATVVQTLNMAGVFSPNDIIKVTGHKSTLSLNNYDPHMRGDKRANMAVAIGLKRGNGYQPIAQALKKLPAASNSVLNKPEDMVGSTSSQTDIPPKRLKLLPQISSRSEVNFDLSFEFSQDKSVKQQLEDEGVLKLMLFGFKNGSEMYQMLLEEILVGVDQHDEALLLVIRCSSSSLPFQVTPKLLFAKALGISVVNDEFLINLEEELLNA